MDWERQLISLYLMICKEYKQSLWATCERFTNGGRKSFTDEEAMTIYLFGVLKGFNNIKAMHRYAKDHLSSLFPMMPQYAGFIHRINRLHEAFRHLIDNLQSQRVAEDDADVYLVDSFPIVLAHHQHAYTAKVAQEVAGKSYNATKKMYYYGVKAHIVARKREATLPDIEILVLESASRQDGPMFDQIRPMLNDNLVFADQAYKRADADEVEQSQNLKVLTPVTKTRGQKKLEPEERHFSKAVSRMRQPIETLFGWIQRRTAIQNASLIRSTAGLLTHIFGKLAAAITLRSFPFFDF